MFEEREESYLPIPELSVERGEFASYEIDRCGVLAPRGRNGGLVIFRDQL